MYKINNINLSGLFFLLTSTACFANDTINSASNGLIKIKSNYDVSTTINRLENMLIKKGMTVFKRIDHADGAEKAGLKIRPTQLLIFGNPKVGTPLMICSQTAAIDLPQKALAYKDKNGQVWLIYNDPDYMAIRHHLKDCQMPVQKINKALTKFARAATE